jgi:pimeloyl-ACP methyl ester carboxylesterase
MDGSESTTNEERLAVARRNVPSEGSVGPDISSSDVVAAEACPTPLGWRAVLKSVGNEGVAWQTDREGRVLQGITLGTGTPLYFLNGIGGTHEMFALTAWLLREDYRCVLWNYPDRTQGVKTTSAAEYSADLMTIANHLGDEQFTLHATSFGGLVGLHAMLESPHRVSHAVIQDGFAYRRLTLAERTVAGILKHVPGRFSRIPFRRVIQERNHRAWFPPFDLSRLEFFLENVGSVPIAAVAERASLIGREDLRDRLGEIETEVLLIQCEGGGIVSETCQAELARGLVNSRAESLNNSGHLPYLTHPHRLTKLMRGFLTEEKRPVVANR